MAPDLVSVTSYGPPFQIRMTNLGHPDLVSMTSRGHPNLVSMTSLALCNRHEEFLKKSKKVWKQFFSKFSPYLLWSWGGFTSYISRCLGSVGSLLMAFMIKISIFRAIFLRKSTNSEKNETLFLQFLWVLKGIFLAVSYFFCRQYLPIRIGKIQFLQSC